MAKAQKKSVGWLEKVFQEGFPLEKPSPRKVGVALEFPGLANCGDVSNFNAGSCFNRLIDRGWSPIYDKVNQALVGAKNGEVIVTYGIGISIVKIIILPQASVNDLYKIFSRTYFTVNAAFNGFGEILGLGVNPFCSKIEWAKDSKMAFLASRVVNPKLANLTLAASSRVFVEVSRQEAIGFLNIMNALAGIFLAIFANSSVAKGQGLASMSGRQSWWDELPQGRSGFSPKFNAFSEYADRVLALPCILARTNGRFFSPSAIAGKPEISFKDFASDLRQEALDEQLDYHLSTLWNDSYLNPRFGTVGINCFCSQPFADSLAPAAFCLGVAENLDEVWKYIENVNWEAWFALRSAAVKGGMAAIRADKGNVWLSEKLVKLADAGLRMRRLAETRFLEPIKQRVHDLRCPAETALGVFLAQGEDGLRDYATDSVI